MNQKLRDLITAGSSLAQAMHGDQFTYLGNTYVGIFAAGQPNVVMVIQGYTETIDYTLRCTREQFTAMPAAKGTITYNGATLSIDSIMDDGVHYVMQLVKRR